jgi:hypothetical protein
MSEQGTFWVTNNTDKALALLISAVEVRSGEVWTNYAKLPGFGARLVFSEELGKSADIIGPYQADWGSLDHQRLPVPPAGPWRVKAFASEKLPGPGSLLELARREHRMLDLRFRQGITNAPLNPFSTNVSRYGHTREVVSEEVLPVVSTEESAPEPVATATKRAAVLRTASPEAIARAREAMRLQIDRLTVGQATNEPATSTPQ